MASQDDSRMMFLRITIVGSSSCGKTSLATAFVNHCCPSRYSPTQKAVVYHKKFEITVDGERDDLKQPAFLEVEDTPGSELGVDCDDDVVPGQSNNDSTTTEKLKRGSRVVVMPYVEKAAVLELFEDPKYKDKLRYIPRMDAMLGQEYTIQSVGQDGRVGLPSIGGCDGGQWFFPPKAVRLKVSMDMPIDKFLALGEKTIKLPTKFEERKQFKQDLQFPLSAYERPCDNPDIDRTLTRNRMGFLICFDVSDESGDSLREAMRVYTVSKKIRQKNPNQLVPIVWLIGCKADKTSMFDAIRLNTLSAQAWTASEGIRCLITSAREFSNVNHVFLEMVQAIAARESLWTLNSADEQHESEDDSGCFLS